MYFVHKLDYRQLTRPSCFDHFFVVSSFPIVIPLPRLVFVFPRATPCIPAVPASTAASCFRPRIFSSSTPTTATVTPARSMAASLTAFATPVHPTSTCGLRIRRSTATPTASTGARRRQSREGFVSRKFVSCEHLFFQFWLGRGTKKKSERGVHIFMW